MGSNVAARHGFDAVFNSKNIADIRGGEFDLVVSAGNRADSFRINNAGADDLAEIDALADHLERARIGKLVLVSTVCVYPEGGSPDERTPLSADGLTPYGANRLHQERRLGAAFDTLVVRLPQLYGDGLKKGIVYDLAHDYRVEHIRPAGRFQYYDVRSLWRDVQTALENGLDALNVSSPALDNATVAREVFGIDVSANAPVEPESPFARMYTRDMRSVHAELFGGSDGYFCTREEELDGIRSFVRGLPEPSEES